MTSVVEYQYWVYKIRIVFFLKLNFYILRNEEVKKGLNSDFSDHSTVSKIE